MADPLDLTGLVGLSADQLELCTLEGSCVTGFEPMAQEEIKEILDVDGIVHRGRVLFDLPVSRVKEALRLRTVNNLWVLVGHTHKFAYPEPSGDPLASLADFTEHLAWEKSLAVWKHVFDYTGNMFPTKDMKDQLENTEQESEAEDRPSFRCTCYRSGTNHSFTSTAVSSAVGGRLHDTFHWKPKMKDYNIEIVINCDVDQVYVGVALTNTSLFNRTVSHFGPTTLKATICASLVRLAQVKSGDIVLDPMCGGGSIPLEGSQMNIGAFFLGGEIHDKAILRTRANLEDVRTKHSLAAGPRMDCLRWSALYPTLRDGSVDVLISDLPFGKRSGSKADNRVLYPRTLLAMARVVRPETGRAVLLTQDKTTMFKSIGKSSSVSKYWKLNRQLGTNIGGLKALVFLFTRTRVSPP